MGFMLSPGVDVKEIDLTNVIPAVSTSIGGTVGAFNWGPIDQIVTVGSEKDLVSVFGKPDTRAVTCTPYFFNASTFLKYGNALKVLRYSGESADTAFVNAAGPAASSTGGLVKNIDHYNTLTISEATHGNFVARCPGTAGNDLKVTVITPGSGDVTTVSGGTLSDEAKLFDSAPGTNEIHILVQDVGGSFAEGATASTPITLESYANVSILTTAKAETGGSNYYIDVLNRDSSYLFGGHAYESTEVDVAVTSDISITFDGGTDYATISDATIVADYAEFFGDADSVDVNFFIGGALSAADSNTVITAAQTRKDVIAFVSPPVSTTTNKTNTAAAAAVVTHADSINSSSYGVIDGGAVYVYDKYNDRNLFIGASGLVAGLNAYTDDVADPWFSPAGFNRGQLRSVIKLAYNPTNIQRDDLYKARVNPLVSFPGQGTVLFGDKTALSKPSAFDRINVRRLFITIEKAIATAAKFQLFEFNDEFTRAMFRNMTEPFLREVKGRRGITDFAVICDETNNTGNIIDTNQFVADIYVKPARSINFITLNFIATRTGIEFSEVIGK
jgi:phage tail sheath protein FI